MVSTKIPMLDNLSSLLAFITNINLLIHKKTNFVRVEYMTIDWDASVIC